MGLGAVEDGVSPIKALVCGAFGGVTSTVAGFPFDTCKVRQQTSQANSLREIVLATLRRENGLSFYKGVTPAMTAAVIESSSVFVANSVIQRQLKRAKNGKELTFQELGVAGGLSGVISATLTCPAEIVKCRMQARQLNNSYVHQYRSATACWRALIVNEGASGIFKGLPMQIARDVPFMFAFFGSYETICHGVCKKFSAKNKSELSGPLITFAGGAAGAIGWTFTIPMDVVKSQMQVHAEQGTHMSQVISEIYAHHGLRGFFRGLPAVIVRAFPCNGFMFLGYEFANRVLDQNLSLLTSN